MSTAASSPPGRRPAPSSVEVEIQGGHAGQLRRANLERVQAFVMDRRGPFTRAELIEATGLSAPTVGRLVRDLIRGGLVRGVGSGPSRGGRPPFSMEFNARHGFVATIVLGLARTRLAVADLRGERLAQETLPLPKAPSPREMLEEIAAALRSLLQDAGVPGERLLAVSVASPGLVDPATGTVVALAPSLGHWSDVMVGPILADALRVPVHVENDVNLAVVGEHWKGAARDHATCAYIDVGRGIGAGILVDGALHRGHHLMAGEIAFMCLDPGHAGEAFGDRGCLETLAGLDALAARWPGARGDADRWVDELYDAVRAGDREAGAAVEAAATLVGIAAANLSLVIDPSLVVVGGEVAPDGSPFLDHVRRTAARIVPTPTAIVASALGEEAALWGGLLTATAHARAGLRPGASPGRA
jgi:predicted NBD/HSP70 family sugar kinase